MSASKDRRTEMLREMRIGPRWVRRDAGPAVPGAAQEEPDLFAETERVADDARLEALPAARAADLPLHPSAAPDEAIARMDWNELRAAVAGCVRCRLCESRTKTVFGVGDEKATWLFVGEGPGRNEDLQGEPFVGNAGKLLDSMLLAMGLRRGENAYIANIVKCRPTDASGKDRPPDAAESSACLPYLQRQIALIEPTVIVALGKTAALTLLGLGDVPVSKLRGKVHRYAERPLVVTYHPAYLLRNLLDKKKAWEDLCLAMSAYGAGTV